MKIIELQNSLLLSKYHVRYTKDSLHKTKYAPFQSLLQHEQCFPLRTTSPINNAEARTYRAPRSKNCFRAQDSSNRDLEKNSS